MTRERIVVLRAGRGAQSWPCFRLRPIELTPQDKQGLLAFLRVLSGVIRDAE